MLARWRMSRKERWIISYLLTATADAGATETWLTVQFRLCLKPDPTRSDCLAASTCCVTSSILRLSMQVRHTVKDQGIIFMSQRHLRLHGVQLKLMRRTRPLCVWERLVWLVCLFISSVTLRVTEVCGKFLPEVGLRQTQNLDLIQMWILGLLKDCLLWYWTKLNFLPHFLGMHPCNSFW